MKRCTTCQEEVADKFSFCPVDGTPLSLLVETPPVVEVTPPRLETQETVATRLADTFAGRLEEATPNVTTAQVSAVEPQSETIGQPINSGFAATNEAFHQAANNSPEIVTESIKKTPDNSQAFTKLDGELHLTILEDQSLVSRLGGEVAQVARNSQLTWPEFKRDPFGFTKRTFTGYGSAAWSVLSRPAVWMALLTALATMGLAATALYFLDNKLSGGDMSRSSVILLSIGALLLLGGLLVAWLKRERPQAIEGVGYANTRIAESGSSNNDLAAIAVSLGFVSLLGVAVYFGSRLLPTATIKPEEQLELTQMIPTEIPKEEEPPKKEGAAGNNKGKGGGSLPKPSKPQGGGGGGRENEVKPVSKGETPPMSNQPTIVVPTVKPPPERPTLLPSMPTLAGDPKLTRMPRNMTFGDPDSKSTDPSPGKGEGEGFGGGKGNGAGKGDGDGLGPGRGGNTGGGDRKDGGGGPGGGGDNKPKPPEIDYNRPFSAKEVTRKAQIISKPEPGYTEDARKNSTTGVVTLRVLLASNGAVGQISPVSRLPNGLTEKAIEAARKIRFTPAQKDGRNVGMWIVLQYDFNIY